MATPPPTRQRWFRYSTRTLFVVVTAVAVFLAHHVNWIRQRHNYLRDHPDVENAFGREVAPAPGLLWLFGESGHLNIAIEVTNFDYHPINPPSQAWEPRLLFPEANIRIIHHTEVGFAEFAVWRPGSDYSFGDPPF